MTEFWVILALVLIALPLFSYFKSKFPKGQTFLRCEFWIYCPDPKFPKLEDVMQRMVADNPFNSKGRVMIGNREGLLFSDVRFNGGLVLRSKNPRLFRPDLFSEAVEPTPALLQAIHRCQGLVRISYVSSVPVVDFRHLQFMAHYAGAILDLCDGLAVFDPVSEELFLAEEFRDRLKLTTQERPDLVLRIAKLISTQGIRLESRGLVKIGLPECVSGDLPEDEITALTAVFEEFLGDVWKSRELPETWKFEHMGSQFRVTTKRRTLTSSEIKFFRERGGSE